MTKPKPWPEVKLGENFTVELGELQENDKLLEMCWIPSGSFLMGSPETEEGRGLGETPHEVIITDGFWLSKYPITHFHWFEGLELSQELSHLPLQHRNIPKGVRWYEAMMFCWELNRKVFYRSGGYEKVQSLGYRFTLPTDAQWEYACRAGTQTAFYNGNDIAQLEQIAWYKHNSNKLIHPVGEKVPNPWGLYDMLGNVHEWCLDVFVEYPNSSFDRHSGEEPLYNIRGGDQQSEARKLRCASRAYTLPRVKWANMGFRLCFSNLKYEPVFY